MNIKTIFGLVILIGFGSMLLMNFGEQVTGYMDFTEASETGDRAHVIGKWMRDQPTEYNVQSNTFSFMMADEHGLVKQVRYAQPKPPNFEDAMEVVVEGYMHQDSDVFIAESILVKCPSKYNDIRGLEESEAAAVNPTS